LILSPRGSIRSPRAAAQAQTHVSRAPSRPSCRTYSETTGRRIFYEWTLIAGQNDTPAHARAVGALLRSLPAQVNLIPLNPTAGYAGAPTRGEAAKTFQRILRDEFALPSTVRQRRGIDIAAGCGQLAVAE
jgi:23S rRNA (adenine2503-C2)-methyltransferase